MYEVVKNLPEIVIWEPSEDTVHEFGTVPRVRTFFTHADAASIAQVKHRFAKTIREDPELMLLAAKKCTAILSFLSESLHNDPNFALQVAKTLRLKAPPTTQVLRANDCLVYFSEKVRRDKKVARAFVRLHGQSYKLVPYSLRKLDISLARIACHTYPMALVECLPGVIERKLTSDKKFMLGIFSSCRGKKGHPMMWRILSSRLRSDPELAIEAMASGCCDVQDLPLVWRNDREFWLRVLEKNCFLWLDVVPSLFRDDPAFVCELSRFAPVFQSILNRFPSLAWDRDMWKHRAAAEWLLGTASPRTPVVTAVASVLLPLHR